MDLRFWKWPAKIRQLERQLSMSQRLVDTLQATPLARAVREQNANMARVVDQVKWLSNEYSPVIPSQSMYVDEWRHRVSVPMHFDDGFVRHDEHLEVTVQTLDLHTLTVALERVPSDVRRDLAMIRVRVAGRQWAYAVSEETMRHAEMPVVSEMIANQCARAFAADRGGGP